MQNVGFLEKNNLKEVVIKKILKNYLNYLNYLFKLFKLLKNYQKQIENVIQNLIFQDFVTRISVQFAL